VIPAFRPWAFQSCGKWSIFLSCFICWSELIRWHLTCSADCCILMAVDCIKMPKLHLAELLSHILPDTLARPLQCFVFIVCLIWYVTGIVQCSYVELLWNNGQFRCYFCRKMCLSCIAIIRVQLTICCLFKLFIWLLGIWSFLANVTESNTSHISQAEVWTFLCDIVVTAIAFMLL